MRALRTETFLYIRNFEPERWPAGDPDFVHFSQGIYGDIDRCATKSYLYENRNDPTLRPLFELSFGRRPAEELYDLRQDPDQMRNVAGQPAYADEQRRLSAGLLQRLRETGDPRALGQPAPWDGYPYHAAYRDRMK